MSRERMTGESRSCTYNSELSGDQKYLSPHTITISAHSNQPRFMDRDSRPGSPSGSSRRRYDDSERDEREYRSSRQDKRPRKYDSGEDHSRKKRPKSRSGERRSDSREEGSRRKDGSPKGQGKSVSSSNSTFVTLPTSLHYRRKRDRSEDRRARKAEKKRIREEEEARQVAELSAYSATDNPFHDVNLSQQFRWHKKTEKERKQGLTLAEAQRRDALRRQEAKEELERLNRRRAQREEEQRLREEEELRMQRLQETAQMSEWLSKEEGFQLDQERKRAAIRIKEKRAKAIDFLALNLKYVNPHTFQEEGEDREDAGLEIDLDEPYKILDVCLLLLSASDSAQDPCRTSPPSKRMNFMTT